MAFYAYVLKSLRCGTRYVGSTDDPIRRLSEHNAGKCRYTRNRRPWALIHHEVFPSRIEARRREMYLKTGQGREHLDKLYPHE